MSTSKCLSYVALIVSVLCLSIQPSKASEWFPLEVDVWDPPFNTKLERRSDTYVPLTSSQQPWKVCVSIPHLKDAYWVAVNFALVDEAKRLGIRLRIMEAGGYDKLDVQREQIKSCMATEADGLIVSGITETGINDLVDAYAAEGRPVIDLINWISAEGITARTAATYWDNGYKLGNYLKVLTAGVPTSVIWFPGPKGPGWSAAGDKGFRDGIDGSAIEILETGWGDTGRADQARLIEAALDKHGTVDFIIGTSVSAEAAVDIARERGIAEQTKVLAYYYGPGVHRGVKRGQILASPTDKQGLQARLAIDIVVRALEKQPYIKHVGPKVEIIDRSNIREFDETTSIPPRGFRPVFNVDDWSY